MFGMWRRVAIRRRVMVNMKDGFAFDAILWKRKGPYLVLRDATYLEPGAAPVKVDGDAIVDNRDVAWIQVPNDDIERR